MGFAGGHAYKVELPTHFFFSQPHVLCIFFLLPHNPISREIHACHSFFFSPLHQEALALLGIRHYFKGVFGAKSMGDTCKPDKEAFQGVLEAVGADPSKTGGHARHTTCKNPAMKSTRISSDGG